MHRGHLSNLPSIQIDFVLTDMLQVVVVYGKYNTRVADAINWQNDSAWQGCVYIWYLSLTIGVYV